MRKHRRGSRLLAQLAGATDLLRHRIRLKEGFYGPFNGQRKRIAIIEAILSRGDFGCAIETGTFRGTTTKFLSDRFPSVVSVEVNPRYLAFARLRLRKRRNVEIIEGDSAAELPAILRKQNTGKPIFVYLDAHWGNLPLAKELNILEQSSLDYVAVIDDFEVPGDDGYGYDSYGKARGAIGPALVFKAVPRLRRLWVPAAPSDIETGSMRGTGFLASPGMEPLLEALAEADLLRPVGR
jgi:predicted O-methyltransferase YrrM